MITQTMKPGLRATLDAVTALGAMQARSPAQVSAWPALVDERSERLGRILLAAHPALTPAHDHDLETLWAWMLHGRATGYLRDASTPKGQREWEQRFFGILPNIEYTYALLQREELWHQARMATLPPNDQDAYLDRLEARLSMEQDLSCLSIAPSAGAALGRILAADSPPAGNEVRTQWTGQAALAAFVWACEELARAVAASAAGSNAREVAQTYNVNAGVQQFACAALILFADAVPAILNAHTGTVAGKESMANPLAAACNKYVMPGIALAVSHLASSDEQIAEVARWQSHGWGLVPRSGQLAWWLMDLTCWANCHAPDSNPGAIRLRVELARAWESVENALDSFGQWHD